MDTAGTIILDLRAEVERVGAEALAALAGVEAERDAARAEVEELRLTLAAEQGRAEGAPSTRWKWIAELDWWEVEGVGVVRRTRPHGWCFYGERRGRVFPVGPAGATARAAMLAADKAQG